MYRRSDGRRFELRSAAVRGRLLLARLEETVGLMSHVYTLLAFLLAAALLPAAFVAFWVVRWGRQAVMWLLKHRYPQLEFVEKISLRTAVDTHRNQGIITLLIQARGTCTSEEVKSRLMKGIVDRRDQAGNLCFPHLRTPLTTRLGYYAWQKPVSDFNIDYHLIVGNTIFRGRPLSESNIQDYVSDIVSKYLPIELSPWQVVFIPSLVGPEPRFCLLIRIHHLLMSEEGLGLADLLMLSRRPWLHEDQELLPTEPGSDTPFIGLFQPPVALPKLWNAMKHVLGILWNTFILAFDPLENKELLLKSPDLLQCLALLFITCVAIIRQMIRSNKGKQSVLSWILNIITEEGHKRRCTLGYLSQGVINTVHPIRLSITLLTWTWWIVISAFIALPLAIFRELLLLIWKPENAVTTGYWSLGLQAIQETWNIVVLIYTAPRVLLQELFYAHQGPVHQLQTVSLCGRKVVAWSEPVSNDLIRRISVSTGATHSEILMTAIAGALREYFRQLGMSVPDYVLTTTRYLPQEILMNSNTKIQGGILCLPLPTHSLLGDDTDALGCLKSLQLIVNRARSRQTALFLASQWPVEGGLLMSLLPSFIIRLLINVLSRMYAVTLTDISPGANDNEVQRTLWDCEVDNVVYWRPPQSNISLSLTIINYAGNVRLCVMSDAMLSQQQTFIATSFLHQLNELALSIGLSPSPRTSPPSSPLASRSSSQLSHASSGCLPE